MTEEQQWEVLERKRVKIDIGIIAMLIILIVVMGMRYYQVRTDGNICINNPFKYGAGLLERVGYDFDNRAYLITPEGLKPLISDSYNPREEVNLTAIKNLLS